jgi:hypothetical protein
MNKSPKWLLEFKNNIYSQNGEDGIIEKILEMIPDRDKWCVEFGAWDGIYLSNVKYLIDNKNYNAVMIEGSKERYTDLIKNYHGKNNVFTFNKFVGFSDSDNLDNILSESEIPTSFDFLSIDVDGNDYHIWKAFNKYQPKVICIEFNPTIPNEVLFTQPADESINQGSSLLSLVELGKQKGYELVSTLVNNAFFVKSEYFPLFNIDDNNHITLRESTKFVTYIYYGYDGEVFIDGNSKLLWHNIKINKKKLQLVPKYFRKYPQNFTWFQNTIFGMWKRFKSI